MAENQQSHQGNHNAVAESALAHRVAQKAHTLKYLILGVLVVIAAVIAIVNYVRNADAKKQAAASNNVFSSLVTMQGKPDAEIVTVFGKAAKEYAGMPAGIQAGVFEYGYAVDAKNYSAAERAAADFIKNYPNNPLVSRFRLGLAQAQLQQGKATDAMASLRPITVSSTAVPEVYAEAKLAFAQALEMNAEAVKSNPSEYQSRLKEAEAAYNDITSQSRLPSPAQRGHWPQVVVLTADFALVQIKDRLNGHELKAPVGQSPDAVTPEEFEALEGIRPPAADPVAAIENAAAAAREVADAAGETESVVVTEAAQAAAEAMKAAEEKVAAAAAATDESAVEARESAAAAIEAAAEAVQKAEDQAAATLETAVESAGEAAAVAELNVTAAADAAADAVESGAAVVSEAANVVGEEAAAAVNAAEDAAKEEGEKAFGAAARLKARADAAASAAPASEEAKAGQE